MGSEKLTPIHYQANLKMDLAAEREYMFETMSINKSKNGSTT